MNLPLPDIRFATPVFLLLVLAVAAVVVWRMKRRARPVAIAFPSLKNAHVIPTTLRARLAPRVSWLRYAALLLLIVALARPQFGWSERQIESYGVDIMLTLDVSNSMQARDFSPNRLEAAKRVLLDFVAKRKADRVGVVIFGDAPFTLVPLTLDYSAIESFVSRLTLNRLGEQNTALGKGIATAVNRLKDSTAKSKIAVVLTDGVDTIGGIAPMDAAKAAKALGVKVYTIGVGQSGYNEGARSPFAMMMPQRQYEFDEKLLQQIADETGGKYYHASNEEELQKIYGEINRLEKSQNKATDFTWYEERMAFVAVPALLLLLLELLLRNSAFLRIP